jgi:hypothetical protein
MLIFLWVSLLLGSIISIVNNEIYLGLSLFLLFAVNVAYNFTK